MKLIIRSCHDELADLETVLRQNARRTIGLLANMFPVQDIRDTHWDRFEPEEMPITWPESRRDRS